MTKSKFCRTANEKVPLYRKIKEFSTERVTNPALIAALFDSMCDIPVMSLFSRCNEEIDAFQVAAHKSIYPYLTFGEYVLLAVSSLRSHYYLQDFPAVYFSCLQIGFYVGNSKAIFENSDDEKLFAKYPDKKIINYRDGEERESIFTQSLFYVIDLKRYFDFLSGFEQKWGKEYGYFMKQYYELKNAYHLPHGITVGEALRYCFLHLYFDNESSGDERSNCVEIVKSIIVTPFSEKLTAQGVTVQQVKERTKKYEKI